VSTYYTKALQIKLQLLLISGSLALICGSSGRMDGQTWQT